MNYTWYLKLSAIAAFVAGITTALVTQSILEITFSMSPIFNLVINISVSILAAWSVQLILLYMILSKRENDVARGR